MMYICCSEPLCDLKRAIELGWLRGCCTSLSAAVKVMYKGNYITPENKLSLS